MTTNIITTLDAMPTRGNAGRKPKYNWDSLFDGNINVVTQGDTDEDTIPSDTKMGSFRSLARTTANKRGLDLATVLGTGTEDEGGNGVPANGVALLATPVAADDTEDAGDE